MEPNFSAEQLAIMSFHEVSGQVLQITIKSTGRYFFERVNSTTVHEFEKRGWDCKVVPYCGACKPEQINELVHRGLSVTIDGVSTAEFKDLVATPEECLMIYN